MDRVNLIPKELQFGARLKVLRFLRTFDIEIILATWGAFFLLAFLLYSIQSFRVGSLKASVEKEQKEIQLASAKLQELNAKMGQFEQFKNMGIYQMNVINQSIDYLGAERARASKWAEVLKELRRSLPRKVWLSSVATERDLLRIAGGSFSNALISEFMASLRSSSYFSNVNFSYTEKDAISDTQITKFEIICHYYLER